MNDRFHAATRALLDLTTCTGSDDTVMRRLASHCQALLRVSATMALLARPDGVLHPIAPAGSAGLAGLLSIQTREGPCLDSYTTGAPIAVSNLADARPRWPRFASAATAAGFGAAWAVPVRLGDTVVGSLGALTVTGRRTTPDAEIRVAWALADDAAIGITHQRALARAETLAGQLQTALTSRVIVEQAKGVLAERWSTTPDEAFASLRRYARSHNARLADVARSVVERTVDIDALVPAGPQFRYG